MGCVTRQLLKGGRDYDAPLCDISVDICDSVNVLRIRAITKNDGHQYMWLNQKEVDGLLTSAVAVSSKSKQLKIVDSILLKLPDEELLKFFAELVNKRTQSEKEQTTLEK